MTTPDNIPQSESAAVALWHDRITKAKSFWEEDHRRVRQCMEFVQSVQWAGQSKPDTEYYVANMILRMVNQKVATLYAKNPIAVAERRPRLDFAIWDETMESLQYAVEQLSTGVLNPAAQLLVADYLNGRNYRALTTRIGRTLETLYNLQCDLQDVSFKTSMKQLVRRTLVCGVGFVKLDYERADAPTVNSKTLETRLRELSQQAADLTEGKFDMESAEFEATQALNESTSAEYFNSPATVSERLIFDFPTALSITVDPRCRNFNGFVNARWIAQEYLMSVDEINAYFELRGEAAVASDKSVISLEGTDNVQHKRLFEVWDKQTSTQFFICEGHNAWLRPPTPLPFKLRNFWPIGALTFNTPEVEEKSNDMRVTCWPLSDVFLWKSPQVEWNKRRHSMSRHRAGASPKIAVSKNLLTEKDRDNLRNTDPLAGITVVELEGLPPDGDINKLMQVVQHPTVSMELYDTSMLAVDMTQTVGEQPADLGGQNPGETATGQTIAAQSKSVAASSNVDDLDDFLSWLAQSGGEILFAQMPLPVVQELVGPGATWPHTDAYRFNSVVYLKIKAASSGRPDKALHLQNVRELFPILMQLGANPAFLVREALRAYDENINADEAFPLLPPDLGRPQEGVNQSAMSSTVPQPAPTQPAEARNQPPPDLQNGTGVPTVVA